MQNKNCQISMLYLCCQSREPQHTAKPNNRPFLLQRVFLFPLKAKHAKEKGRCIPGNLGAASALPDGICPTSISNNSCELTQARMFTPKINLAFLLQLTKARKFKAKALVLPEPGLFSGFNKLCLYRS